MDEIATLKRMWVAGSTPAEISPYVRNRSVETIRQQAYRQKLPVRYRGPRWTMGQQHIVYEATDKLVEQLSNRMGRTPAAVRKYIMRALVSYVQRGKIAEKVAA